MNEENTPRDETLPELVKADRVGEVLQVNPEAVLGMAQRGDIPCYRANRKVVRFCLAEVLAAMGRGHAR